jgi:hypothetical protein
MKFALAVISCLILLLSGTAGALAVEPANITANVIHDQSRGVLRVNGVPVHRFSGTPPADSGPLTDAVGIGQWLVGGGNVVELEADGSAGKETQLVIVAAPDSPNLYEAKIEGSGKTSYELALKDVPRWGWFAAEAWTGGDKDLLAAVAALHAAYAKGDAKTIVALYRPFADDMKPYAGDVLAGAEEGLAEGLKTAKVAPLPAELIVTAFYGNRLFVVAAPDGSAPIQVTNGESTLEAGRFWIRKDGKWQIIRPQ